MSSTDGKEGGNSFKKRAHRPWNTLLEDTITEPTLEDGDELLNFNLSDDSDPFGSEFNFVDEDLESSAFSQKTMVKTERLFDLDGPHTEIRHELENARQQNPISLGGFFQPQQISTVSTSQNGRKINSLLSDLKIREKKISSLTSDLKISEAIERAEQAELNKKAEEHGRLSAETRMRQAVEQANAAAEQFHQAMEQANQAAMAQREEEMLRKAAEEQAKAAKARVQQAEANAHHERLSRIAAEEKTQQALLDAEQAMLYKQQLQVATEQIRGLELAKQTEENRRANAEQQYENLNKTFVEIEHAHKTSASKIYSLESSLKDLTHTNSNNEQKLAEVTAQRDKLRTIIEAEQELRKLAERRMQEALVKAERSEKARQVEEQQRKIIDERAKRAVAHASRTVMHLLNAPVGNEYGLQIPSENLPKEKVKIRVESPIEEDDYSF